MMICTQCGANNSEEAFFCQKCGKQLQATNKDNSTLLASPSIPASPYESSPYTSYGSSEPIYPPPPPLAATGSTLNPYEKQPSTRTHSNRMYLILITILIIVLIGAGVFVGIVLGKGNSQGSITTTNNSATTLTTPTTTTSAPHETLLYAADWSNGLNGWISTSDWTVLNGMLHNDETDSTLNDPTIVAPYQVEGITDYAVEVSIQLVSVSPCFDVTTIRASGSTNNWQGYKATICHGNAYINAGSITGTSAEQLAQVQFGIDNAWHTYRFEAKGTQLSLFKDGQLILKVNDSRYPSGGKLGFKSFETELNISSFKVFAI